MIQLNNKQLRIASVIGCLLIAAFTIPSNGLVFGVGLIWGFIGVFALKPRIPSTPNVLENHSLVTISMPMFFLICYAWPYVLINTLRANGK